MNNDIKKETQQSITWFENKFAKKYIYITFPIISTVGLFIVLIFGSVFTDTPFWTYLLLIPMVIIIMSFSVVRSFVQRMGIGSEYIAIKNFLFPKPTIYHSSQIKKIGRYVFTEKSDGKFFNLVKVGDESLYIFINNGKMWVFDRPPPLMLETLKEKCPNIYQKIEVKYDVYYVRE